MNIKMYDNGIKFFQCYNGDYTTTNPIDLWYGTAPKTTDGYSINGFYWEGRNEKTWHNTNWLLNAKLCACALTEQEHNRSRTSFTELGSSVQSKSHLNADGICKQTITVVVTATEDITINSFQVLPDVYVSVRRGASLVWESKTLLMCAIYLESPVTIHAGESKTFAFDFDLI